LPNGKFYEIASTEFTNLPEQWQHLAFKYAGRAIELYIDGVLKGWAAAGGVFDDAAVDFLLKNRVTTCCHFYFGGGVNEVTLRNKALTADDIKEMMANELKGNVEALELYYKGNYGVLSEEDSSIKQAISEVDAPLRDATLSNLALTSSANMPLQNKDKVIGFEDFTVTNLQLYPNSSNEVALLIIKDSYLTATIKVIDNLGKMVWFKQFKNTVSNHQVKLNLEGLAKGVYLVTIRTEKGNGVKKLVVE